MTSTLAPCGTHSAYRRHLQRGEDIDAECIRGWVERRKLGPVNTKKPKKAEPKPKPKVQLQRRTIINPRRLPIGLLKLENELHMLRIGGKTFRCTCGCNVFRRPKSGVNTYHCNACQAIWSGE